MVVFRRRAARRELRALRAAQEAIGLRTAAGFIDSAGVAIVLRAAEARGPRPGRGNGDEARDAGIGAAAVRG